MFICFIFSFVFSLCGILSMFFFIIPVLYSLCWYISITFFCFYISFVFSFYYIGITLYCYHISSVFSLILYKYHILYKRGLVLLLLMYISISDSKIVKRLRRQKYDPVIIESTIGLVLGPSTALYISFLKHCTPSNEAMGTIWRDLSEPPQRKQGPDPRPLWLLVETPLVLRHELASGGRNIAYSGGCLYIFLIYCFYHLTCLCNNFYGLSALVGCWSSAYIRRIIYNFFHVCPFDYTAFAVSGKVWIL